MGGVAVGAYVYRDGQRLTPAMAADFDALNHEFYRITGCWLRVSSGIRTYEEQVSIFLSRYVPSWQVNGRRVYDWRWWNGVQYGRISSAGTVAAPGTSNHEINVSSGRNGALDLRDTGNDAGIMTRGSWRANVFDSIAWKYGYDSEGYAFGEPWHKRYNRDPWRAVPGTPAGGGATPLPTPPAKTADEIEEEEVGAAVEQIKSAIRREGRIRKFNDTTGRHALGRPGLVIGLPDNAAEANKVMQQLYQANPLMFPPEEFNGNGSTVDPTAFFTLVDYYDPENVGKHHYGVFVKNWIDLTERKTYMVRRLGDKEYTTHYATRQLVWANMRDVELRYNGKVIVGLYAKGTERLAKLADGTMVTLTAAEVDAANAQRPAGQAWTPAT